MDFDSWLNTQLPIWIGRPLRKLDGTPAERIDAAEARLGIRIPQALRALYIVAGEVHMLMQSFQRFRTPELWQIEDGKLVFLEENQGVCKWGCDISNAVWQKIDGENTDWYSESVSIETLLRIVLPYQLAQGGWSHSGMRSTSKLAYSTSLSSLSTDLGWPKIVDHNGLVICSQDAQMLWGLQPSAHATTALIFISCLHENDFKRLLKSLKFEAL